MAAANSLLSRNDQALGPLSGRNVYHHYSHDSNDRATQRFVLQERLHLLDLALSIVVAPSSFRSSGLVSILYPACARDANHLYHLLHFHEMTVSLPKRLEHGKLLSMLVLYVVMLQ